VYHLAGSARLYLSNSRQSVLGNKARTKGQRNEREGKKHRATYSKGSSHQGCYGQKNAYTRYRPHCPHVKAQLGRCFPNVPATALAIGDAVLNE
jgi:hypothetical protein